MPAPWRRCPRLKTTSRSFPTLCALAISAVARSVPANPRDSRTCMMRMDCHPAAAGYLSKTARLPSRGACTTVGPMRALGLFLAAIVATICLAALLAYPLYAVLHPLAPAWQFHKIAERLWQHLMV